MKKLVLVAVLVSLFIIGFAVSAFADEPQKMEWKHTLGLDLPTFGWVKYNNQGQIIKVRGINLGLGYSAKNYFKPVKLNAFNPYWQWGTVVLIIPYIGIGGDYVWKSGFYAGVGTVYLVPYIYAGFYF